MGHDYRVGALTGPRAAAAIAIFGLSMAATIPTARAGDVGVAVSISISRQSLASALTSLANQTDLQILFSPALVEGMEAPALSGSYSATQALQLLLSGTHLEFVLRGRDVVVIRSIKSPLAQHTSVEGNAPAPVTTTAVADAASTNGATSDDKLDEVIVTGTNIRRADQGALPLTVLDQDALVAHDASTASALLNSLPEVPNAPLNETANASYSARGDFDAVNLRGIGTGNTLVLLNGRRLVPHPISSTDENGLPAASVNVNQLPTQGIDHIEILRDGASSIYGTDAVAGVVNYRTKKDFQGLEFTGRTTANEHGDGKEIAGSIDAGTTFAGGRGHISSLLDYYNREAIYLKDRSFSDYGNHTASAPAPWNAPSTLIPLSANPFYGLQSTGTYPSFKIGSSPTTTYLVPQANGTVGVTTTAPVRGTAANGYFYNLNQYQAIQPASHRLNWMNQIDFDLSDSVTVFGELSLYRADSTLIRQPVAYNSGNFTDQAIVVPATSQWNPFGQPVTLLSKYLTDIGPERDTITDTIYRVLGGLRGHFGGDWTWESAAYYSEGKVTDIAHNAVRQSLFRGAIQSGAYNPFGFTFANQNGSVVVAAPYTNPASASAGFISEFRRDGETSLSSVDFHTTGKVVDAWAGPISAAVGGEVRQERYKFSMPPYNGLNPPGSGLPTDDNDFLLYGPAANWSASRVVASAYAEADVPLTAPVNEIPFIRSLDLTASARYEHYGDFGSATKPKVGLSWRPVSWALVRASYNQGFRAPNLPLLNGGDRKTLQSFLDPVLSTTGPHWSVLAGNPNLRPENSVGKSIGLVIDVPKVDGLSVSADYWQISRRNLIITTSITDIMNSDAASLAPVIAAHPGVPVSQLNLGSGTANYLGDPRVIRNAADNSIYSVDTLPFNSAKAFISGIDYNMTWRLPETAAGRFMLRSEWSFLDSYYQYATATSFKDNLLDRDGAAKWRGNVALSWSRHQWSAGTSAYYIGPFQDSSVVLPAATPAQQAASEALYQSLGRPGYIAKVYNLGQVAYRYVVPSTLTYNAFVGYDFDQTSNVILEGMSLRLGVVNLSDVKPPLDGGFAGFKTTVYTGLVTGRTWTLDFSKKF